MNKEKYKTYQLREFYTVEKFNWEKFYNGIKIFFIACGIILFPVLFFNKQWKALFFVFLVLISILTFSIFEGFNYRKVETKTEERTISLKKKKCQY